MVYVQNKQIESKKILPHEKHFREAASHISVGNETLAFDFQLTFWNNFFFNFCSL